MSMMNPVQFSEILEGMVQGARTSNAGAPADYIPELSRCAPDATSVAVAWPDGSVTSAGDAEDHRFTLQSTAKLILLAGLLEERGEQEVFDIVGKEPAGTAFASLARLETDSPKPANPLINSGAIALAASLEGGVDERLQWIHRWSSRLLGEPVAIDQRILNSERDTGDRNRAIAYFLRHHKIIHGEVDSALEAYFALCALESSVVPVARMGLVLARGGCNAWNERILSERTARCVVSLMLTCGMYDESGSHLLETGLPAKSGVSGVIVAVAPQRAGITVASPRINDKGASVRGQVLLRALAQIFHGYHAGHEMDCDGGQIWG